MRRDRHTVELRVLGRFQLLVDGRRTVLPLQAQRLLALLAIAPPDDRATAAGRLWSDVPQGRAQANLRNAVWQVASLPGPVLVSSRRQVELDEAVRLDLAEARRVARSLAEGRLPEQPAAAVDVLEHDLLPGWDDDDWLTVERERQRQARLHALEALSELTRTAGRHGDAVAAAGAAVRAEPLRESAQQALISAYLAERNVGEAVRQFGRYRELLAGELGIRPGEQLAGLLAGLPRAAVRPSPRRPAAAAAVR